MTPRGRERERKSRWGKLVQFSSVQERIPSTSLFSLYRRDRGFYFIGEGFRLFGVLELGGLMEWGIAGVLEVLGCSIVEV